MQSQVVESGEFDTFTIDFYHIHFEALVDKYFYAKSMDVTNSVITPHRKTNVEA